MKATWFPLWILCLSVLHVPAQTSEPVLKLTGIISLPGFKRALLESPGAPRGEGSIALSKGAREGRVEVITINDREGSVEVVAAERRLSLKFEPQAMVRPTETSDSNLRLSQASLDQVLDVYATISGRTVLQHPTLRASRLSLNAAAKTRPEAVVVLEQLFQEHGVASVHDGSKFVMIVPSSLTNTVTARSASIATTTISVAPILDGTINFQNADSRQALTVYGLLVGRKLVNAGGLRAFTIRLRTVTDLTRPEAAYALEMLFLWNGVKIVPVGEAEFDVVAVPPGQY